MQVGDSQTVPPIGGVFRWSVPVRWGDLDAQNHVNNTLYFRYVEEARVQLFAHAGIDLPASKVAVLARASCEFLKPISYPATVVVSLILRRLGRSSMEMEALIGRDDEPDALYAKGAYVVVGTDPATGKSSPWTPQEVAQLSAVLSG
ncbi:acyl-CoA thioesterase [Parapusillimonas sp. SGNA-6]|nr:acyl-CoA thioesterase [Parapusillimonas sp. SGNA-6]